MRTLVIVAARPEELHPPRRALAYDRLVVLAPRDRGRVLLSALGPDAPVAEVRELPEDDLLSCFAVVDRLLADAAGETRVAVDGGTLAMSLGALLACVSRGAEAWFFQHKTVRLPALRAIPIAERFGENERRVLAALGTERAFAAIARRTRLPESEVKRALLRLRKEGAVETDAKGARRTRLGDYYVRAAPSSLRA